MAIHHELQIAPAHYGPVDDIIHRQAHPIQSLNVHIRRIIIHNKIRKLMQLVVVVVVVVIF